MQGVEETQALRIGGTEPLRYQSIVRTSPFASWSEFDAWTVWVRTNATDAPILLSRRGCGRREPESHQVIDETSDNGKGWQRSITPTLFRQIDYILLREWRKVGPQVQRTGIKLPKRLVELALPDMPCDISCRLFVQNRPKRRRLGIPGSRQATKEKQRRVLRFENERFQAALRNDAEIGVGHIESITILRRTK